MTKIPTNTEIEAAIKAISEIPASSGGMMALYPSTLLNKLSPQLIETIARVALEAAIQSRDVD